MPIIAKQRAGFRADNTLRAARTRRTKRSRQCVDSHRAFATPCDPRIIREADTYYLVYAVYPFRNREEKHLGDEDNGSSPGIELFSSRDRGTHRGGFDSFTFNEGWGQYVTLHA